LGYALRVIRCKAKRDEAISRKTHEIKAAGRFNRHGVRNPTVREGAKGGDMKKQTYTMIAMLFLVGSMAVAARAQTSGRSQLTANIPFEFSVGNQTLPAGDYTVAQINPISDHVVLQLRSRDGSSSAMVQMISVTGQAEANAKLIFHRYGNKYFFAQAWVNGDGLQAPRPRAERAAERELAGIKARTETVRLTASR
jgi:hypothetical protein